MIAEMEPIEAEVESRIDDGFPFPLRDYQLASDAGLREQIAAGKKNVLLCSPTGSGKTVTAAHKVWQCWKKGRRAVFVCDRISLINQTSEFFDRCGIPHGVIQSNHWRRKPGERIQVASAQTLAKRGWPEADLIIVDECHGIVKTVVKKIAKREVVTIGLTATPFTRGLGKYYDAVVTVTTNNKLTDEGYISKFRVFNSSAPDMSKVKTVAGEWSDEDCSRMATPIIGDCVAQYLKHGMGKKFIAFGCDVAHCEEMQRQFSQAGVIASLYTYQTPDEERAESIREMHKDDSYIRGLITVSALAKGYDCPSIGVIIMCRPLKSSLAEHIQILGRGLRPHPSKEIDGCLILDHAGNMERFWPDMMDFFENSIHELDDGKLKKKKKEPPKEKKPVKCPKCFHVFKGGPSCPACGYVFPKRESIQHEAGELNEWHGKSQSSDDKRRLYGELKFLATARGKEHWWAGWMFRKLTGLTGFNYASTPPIPASDETKKRVRNDAVAWYSKNKK